MSNSAPGPDDHFTEHNGSDRSLTETARLMLRPLASLRLTVALFALSLVLVFFGTVAQTNEGIWTVVDKYFRSAYVWIPTQLIAKFWMTFFAPSADIHWTSSFPFFGGWTLGTAMLINLLAAHAVRFRLSWKRSGIFMLHTGVVILMLGELITGLYAVESTMTLAKGETSNFVDESLTPELVISRPLDANTNDVVKIPDSLLKHPRVISNPDLPVDVEVVSYWKNSTVDTIPGPPPDDSWIALGSGSIRIVEQPEGAGVDQEHRGDATTVRVKLKKKGTGEDLGQFPLSLWFYPNSSMNMRGMFVPPFRFELDGQQYSIELRNRREYKPYSIRLLKFEHGKYEGTETPNDFASTVEVIDPEFGNSEARIFMNNPLRYRDSSYYQMSVLGRDSGTVLQVVRNPGRIMPYIACAMVSFGLLLHFGILLRGFLRRRAVAELTRREKGELPSKWAVYFPALVVGLCAVWVVMTAIPPTPKPNTIDYYAAGKIPVLHNGRIKPLSTLARTALQAISGQSEVQDIDDMGRKKFAASAVEWFLSGFVGNNIYSGKAADFKVFRIENDQLLSLLKLKPRPEFFRYSLAEIRPSLSTLEAEIKQVSAKDEKKQSLRDRKVLDLAKKMYFYIHVVRGIPNADERSKGDTPNLVPPQADGEQWLKMKDVDDRVDFTKEEREDALDAAFADIKDRVGIDSLEHLSSEERAQAVRMIRARAESILTDTVAPEHRDRVSEAAAAFTELAKLSDAGHAQEFNEALASYRQKYLGHVAGGLESSYMDGRVKIDNMALESFFNHFAPFYLCSNLYVITLILAALSWLCWRQPLLRAAFALGVLTLLVHTFGLLVRMYLQGRPPVTNLYSSAVWIGWGCLLVCLILERIYWNGIAIVVGSGLGALTMMISHMLSEGGDTMEMLQAVLDTNFWLATHVTCMTLGYMATFVAGFIALLYVILGVFTTKVNSELNKDFGKMLYGCICLATFLSFTGTVLGGIWADYSWGRFWGWDAKENGAVMVVIWNTLILHARWAGLVKLRGMALLAIAGNMITIWSWFGTNQLRAGLHSYGFSSELAERCMYSWIILLAPIALGLVPQRYWRSFAHDPVHDHMRDSRRIDRERSGNTAQR